MTASAGGREAGRDRLPPSEVESRFLRQVESTIELWVTADSPHYQLTLDFARGRLAEGRQLVEFLRGRGVRGKILDVGAGNGGVSLGVGNAADFSVITLDLVLNQDLRHLKKATSVPIEQAVGSGHHLPFRNDTFDFVLCLDTIEHVPRPDLMGPEIMRVLRPGGMCMITTPPRLRYWFRRDPHYFIPGLALLPDGMQRFVAETVLRRTKTYDVEHLFWHVEEIARLFPASEREVLWNHDFDPAAGVMERLWYRTRLFFWDRILIRKPFATPVAATPVAATPVAG